MDTEQTLRKRYFRAALALAEMSVTQFARMQGVSQFHVYKVLAGRESARLEAEIDAFIAARLPQYSELPERRNKEDV